MNPHGVHRGPALVSAAHLDEEMQAASGHGGWSGGVVEANRQRFSAFGGFSELGRGVEGH
jgi:hypothetical protein